jgi:mannose-1-phosphate guanylyltransferase
MTYGVIMAGGRGERFWPLSRASRPKQFLKLTSDRTMLEETIERIRPSIPLEQIRIVTGESMTAHILQSIEAITPDMILTEPFGRNTCLAIGLAAIHLQRQDEHAVMVVLSADHLIRPREKLLKILDVGCSIASTEDSLITIGVTPTRPETGYGYIKVGEEYRAEADCSVYRVDAFTEKPKLAVAQEYYYSRSHLWNSGMFIWSAASILSAIDNYQPDMGAALKSYGETIGTDKETSARRALYENASAISIDYAVLEHARNVLTLKADMIWDDIGSWNALERIREKDAENNVVVGEVQLHGTYETTVFNQSDGIIACIGIADMVVVRSDNITLVAHKTKVAEVKQLLAELSKDEAKRKYL